jgi:hypothetical protein
MLSQFLNDHRISLGFLLQKDQCLLQLAILVCKLVDLRLLFFIGGLAAVYFFLEESILL